ncbi:hypothetical protein vseg_001219 [Gypsophila vaccaria]
MGREWYFNWGSKSSSKKGGGTTTKGGGGGGGGRDGGDRRPGMPQVATAAAAVAASGGCMNAVLHMFDFNHFHLCLHPNSNNSPYLQDDSFPLKGVEAPRNSLESNHEDEKDNYSLNTHVDSQIKTNRRDTGLKLVQAPRAKVEDTMSQSSCSPSSARTPTLVARLMGLDILPESTNTTPRSSSSYTHIASSTPPSRPTKTRTKSHSKNNDIQGRPKTPNFSSSPAPSQRRKSMDIVENHRLSLQINKENSIVKEMESSRPSCSAINTKRRDGRRCYNEEENKSPGYYARQIMKQVKETVSRRVGTDITNTISTQRDRDRDRDRELRRDEHLLSTTQPTTKPKKFRKEQQSSVLITSSPKLVKSSENNLSDVQEVVEKVQLKTVTTRENEKKTARFHGHDCYEKTNVELDKLGGATKQNSKVSRKSYDLIRNKKDEQFVRPSTRGNNGLNIDKKCKKTPLSSDLVHSSVPSIVPLKKDSSSTSQTPPKLVETQEGTSKAQISKLTNTTIHLPRGSIQRRYEKAQKEATHKPANHDKNKDDTGTSTSTSTSTSTAECQYISRILKCTGIDRNTPISFTRWFSYSHPLNPKIFHTLEESHYHSSLSSSGNICPIKLINRKLIFHLVDEILADILKPYIQVKPFINRGHNQTRLQINGFQLVKTLCTKIRSFPSVDCKTLQDIDALVEKDMPKVGFMKDDSMAFEDESEDIVTEIEGDIVDSLVHEIALFLL